MLTADGVRADVGLRHSVTSESDPTLTNSVPFSKSGAEGQAAEQKMREDFLLTEVKRARLVDHHTGRG
jgi:hypothetical protein